MEHEEFTTTKSAVSVQKQGDATTQYASAQNRSSHAQATQTKEAVKNAAADATANIKQQARQSANDARQAASEIATDAKESAKQTANEMLLCRRPASNRRYASGAPGRRRCRLRQRRRRPA